MQSAAIIFKSRYRLNFFGPAAFGGPTSAACVLVAALIALAGCQGDGAGAQSPSAVSSFAENVLYGGGVCSEDSSCPGGICAGGTCIGYMMIPSDMARDMAGERVRVAVSANPALAGVLSAKASRVVSDVSGETYARARAADLFRFLPCSMAIPALTPAVNESGEPVRFFASRVLALCGDEAGVRSMAGFLEHGSEPIRLMARTVLEAVDAKAKKADL